MFAYVHTCISVCVSMFPLLLSVHVCGTDYLHIFSCFHTSSFFYALGTNIIRNTGHFVNASALGFVK